MKLLLAIFYNIFSSSIAQNQGQLRWLTAKQRPINMVEEANSAEKPLNGEEIAP